MTVAELIEKLSAMPQGAEVYLRDHRVNELVSVRLDRGDVCLDSQWASETREGLEG